MSRQQRKGVRCLLRYLLSVIGGIARTNVPEVFTLRAMAGHSRAMVTAGPTGAT
jgi:hypothetical protein